MAKIIIDLDSIDETSINAIYMYSDLKSKIKDGEERLIKLKEDLHHLISSTNFKYVEEQESVVSSTSKDNSPSFMGIDSLKGLTYWIDCNRDNGVETKESEELRGIMKRMYNVYSPSGIAHIIRCNFKDQTCLISDMILTIDKINGVITAYNRYDNPYDPFVAFFFSNIYGILEAVEKTSKAVGYTEKKK